MVLDIERVSHTESFIQEDELLSVSCLGWSDLTTEERVKILCRGRALKGIEMGEWHTGSEDYVNWARNMFLETGLCFSKAQYDYVFSSTYEEDLFRKVIRSEDKTIFQYKSLENVDEIEYYLAKLRHLRMMRFDKDHTPELITVMYTIKETDEEKELLQKLQQLGFPAMA